MNDLISRQSAIEALGGNEPVGDPSKMDDDDVVKIWERIRIINIINKLPSAQTERKKGKWIPKFDGKFTGGAYWFDCSICGRTVPEVRNGGWNFCPNCGADMRGEQE